MIIRTIGGDAGFSAGFSNPVQVPDISQIEKMDRQREQAIQSLEISDGFVKCQRCGVAIRMVGGGLARPKDDKIITLESRIRRITYLHSKNKIPDRNYNSSIREMNEELQALLKEEEIRDKLRRLPLYSSRITDFRFVCSACYDEAYKRRNRKKL